MNEALDNFGIRWLQSGGNSEQSVDGVCKNGLKVTVLSQKDVCRNECKAFSSSDKEHLPYILHRSKGKKTGESKKSNAIEMKVWWVCVLLVQLIFDSLQCVKHLEIDSKIK